MGKYSDASNKKRSETCKRYWAEHKHPRKGKASWNKGLTKETDERVRKITEAAAKTLRESGKMKGDKNPSWKGGKYKWTENGYTKVFVRCPEEYKEMSSSNGYVLESRLIMAQHLGYCLTKTEVVHHIDGDTTNNKIENLMLFRNNGEHKKYENNLQRTRDRNRATA